LLDEKNDYLQRVLDSYDPIREHELELKWKLNSKKAVLLNEMAKKRYDEQAKSDKDAKAEMLDYATSIALLQLEAKDIEK